jgi:hypothetical protein
MTCGAPPSRRWRGGGDGAAARGEALRWRQGRAEQSTCSGKKKRGKGSEGLVWKFQELQGPLSKPKFPADVEV